MTWPELGFLAAGILVGTGLLRLVHFGVLLRDSYIFLAHLVGLQRLGRNFPQRDDRVFVPIAVHQRIGAPESCRARKPE